MSDISIKIRIDLMCCVVLYVVIVVVLWFESMIISSVLEIGFIVVESVVGVLIFKICC